MLFLEPQIIPLIEGELLFFESLFTPTQRAHYFLQLMETINWQEEEIQLFGKVHRVPRLVAWYGDEGASYRYAGVQHEPQKWTNTLLELKQVVREKAGVDFNSVLLNLYRNGHDKMGWHSDDEKELGKNPTIASLSFGATRRFDLRYKKDKTQKVQLPLTDGSLLIMRGATQHFWQHQIPAQKRVVAPRINLTFRQILL